MDKTKRLGLKKMPNKYLINHIVEMMSISKTSPSTVNFNTLKKFTIKGKDLANRDYDYLEKTTGFYPFYLNKTYDAVKVNFKDCVKKDEGILLLQDRRTKKIIFLHIGYINNKIMAPFCGTFVVEKVFEYKNFYKVKRISRWSKGSTYNK